jgi:hypothetical protein
MTSAKPLAAASPAAIAAMAVLVLASGFLVGLGMSDAASGAPASWLYDIARFALAATPFALAAIVVLRLFAKPKAAVLLLVAGFAAAVAAGGLVPVLLAVCVVSAACLEQMLEAPAPAHGSAAA